MENTNIALGDISASLIWAGAITYCWTLGAQHRYLKASWLGMAGGIVITILISLLNNGLVKYWGLNLRLLETRDIMVSSLDWGFIGLVGGLAIDWQSGPRPSWSVPVSILGARSLFFILVIVYFAPDWGSITSNMGHTLSLAFVGLTQIVGWGAGLMLAPSTDAILSPDRK
jgi:hypothetical protein